MIGMNINQTRIDRKGLVYRGALLAFFALAPLACTKTETPEEWFIASKNLVPADAKLVASGTGGPLSTTAPESGYFYVGDMTAKKKVADVQISKGETITVSPAAGTIETTNMSPTKIALDPAHRYEI